MTSEKVAAAKFSDLNAYHQLIQTRAAATLTFTSMSLAAGSVLVGLIPKPDDSSLLILFSKFGIAISFCGAILSCFSALQTNQDFEELLNKKLSASQLPDGADFVDCKLREAFIAEFQRKLENLHVANILLTFVYALAVFALCLIVITPLVLPLMESVLKQLSPDSGLWPSSPRWVKKTVSIVVVSIFPFVFVKVTFAIIRVVNLFFAGPRHSPLAFFLSLRRPQ